MSNNMSNNMSNYMSIINILLEGNLSDILYQTSAAIVVSLVKRKTVFVSIDNIDEDIRPVLKYIKTSSKMNCPNSFDEKTIVGDSLVDSIPKFKKNLDLIGKFKNKKYFKDYKNKLIEYYNLETELGENYDNSKYLYIDSNFENNKDYYIDLIDKINNNLEIIIDSKEYDKIKEELDKFSSVEKKINILENVDYKKLRVMAKCGKGGYFTGEELGWWGSFLNLNESIEITDEMYLEYADTNKSSIFIVLSTYNTSEKCIFMIGQILNQTYKNWKLCIIDNGSEEEYGSAIRKNVRDIGDHRIMYLKNETNMKLGDVLNRGIDKFLESGYGLFTWINENNQYFPNFINSLLVKDKNKDIDFVYSGYLVNNIIEIKRYLTSFMWSRKAIKKLGYCNNLSVLEDYDYLIRTFLFLKKENIEYRNLLHMIYDIREENLYVDEYNKLLLFYENIDLSKPLFLYYTKEKADLKLDYCSAYMNNKYNKVVVKNDTLIEYDSINDIIYVGDAYINLAIGLFNLIDKKIIVYDDKSILSKIEKYKNIKLINAAVDVSIVMAYFDNRKEQTLITLKRLEELYGNKYDFEVIIVDDNSLEENRLDEVIDNFSYQIKYKYITAEEKGNRINPCEPYNIGFSLAGGKYVIIQNPECYHVTNILEHVITKLGTRDYFTYSCYSPNSEDISKRVINNLNLINDVKFLCENQTIDKNCDLNWYNHPVYNESNYHFCSAIHRDNLEILGGFDLDFKEGTCFDDDEFLLSIKNVLGLKVTCIYPENGYVIHQYHKRGYVIPEKWVANKKLFDQKKEYFELSGFNYPRLLHLYWDGSPLSMLNFCTILSFNEYHKYWRIILYMPINKTETQSWTSHEQKLKYTEKCYLPELKRIKNLIIRKVDFNKIGFYNEASEVIKSDYFRYHILQKYGGVWSDMDIMYTNNIENKIKFDEDVCLFICNSYSYPKDKLNSTSYKYYPIGWFISKPNNDFFNYILEECRKQYDPSNYQTLGAVLFIKLFPDESVIYDNKNYNSKIKILNEDYYLPWAWNEIDEFVDKMDNTLPDNNFGIHWFNGATKSKEYSNTLTNRVVNNSFSINCYMDKYVNKYRKFFYKTISIIMAYHNKKEQLLITLDSINKSVYNKKYLEVIIVDDCSQEDEKLLNFLNVHDYNFRIKIFNINVKVFYNPCYVYNIGIKESRGEIIILQNPEVMLVNDCIKFVADNLEIGDWMTFNTYGLGSLQENQDIKNFSEIELFNHIKNKNYKVGGNTYQDISNVNGWLNHYKRHFVAYHYFGAIYRIDLMTKMEGGFCDDYKYGICFDDNDFVMYLTYHNFNFKTTEFEEDKPFNIHLFHNKSTNLEDEKLKELWNINKKVYEIRSGLINFPNQVNYRLREKCYNPRPQILK
jgi:hypothetical protein